MNYIEERKEYTSLKMTMQHPRHVCDKKKDHMMLWPF